MHPSPSTKPAAHAKSSFLMAPLYHKEQVNELAGFQELSQILRHEEEGEGALTWPLGTSLNSPIRKCPLLEPGRASPGRGLRGRRPLSGTKAGHPRPPCGLRGIVGSEAGRGDSIPVRIPASRTRSTGCTRARLARRSRRPCGKFMTTNPQPSRGRSTLAPAGRRRCSGRCPRREKLGLRCLERKS